MAIEPCRCCVDNKPGVNGGGNGYGFNRLEGDVRKWAKDNQFARSEFCVPVKNGKRFGGPSWQKTKCGDGRMGFSTRRKGQDDVQFEIGLDGQLRKKRTTLVRSRSARAVASRRARRVDGSRCYLVCQAIIEEAQRDPIVVAQQRKVSKKSERARNRNNWARRGHRKAMRMVA